VVVAKVPFPRPDKSRVLEQIKQAITPRTRLAVIDHITSSSALVLPIDDIVRLCREARVPVLVDGAHAPGQVPLDLTALGADFYTGNCHKWLMAPKGSAFLHARRERQLGLHPVTISHGFEQGFYAEFDWTGTSDPTAFLAVPAALAFFHRLGGHALAERNKGLALQAGALLAARLGTEVGADADMSAAMALVRLPVRAEAQKVREALLRAAIDAPVHAIGDALWLRLSAQAYNDMSDYERLASLLPKVLRGI
jgi:isopenicillin-N epimerase